MNALDWAAFLARNDLVWPTLPNNWNNGAFIGNGRLGSICWQGGNGALRFEISRSDLYDHRSADQPGGWLFRTYRLPNGHLDLSWGQGKPSGTLRLDLWNAEISGTLTGTSGNLQVRCYAHASRPVIVIDTQAPAGAPAPIWTWNPDAAKSPRTRSIPKDYRAYPPQRSDPDGPVQVSVQDMSEDQATGTIGQGVGQYATAWLTTDLGGGRRITYVSLGFSYPGTTARTEALAAVRAAAAETPERLTVSHRDWWHRYYPASFISVPDQRVESFYWAQLYKMGSTSRSGGPLIDLLGP